MFRDADASEVDGVIEVGVFVVVVVAVVTATVVVFCSSVNDGFDNESRRLAPGSSVEVGVVIEEPEEDSACKVGMGVDESVSSIVGWVLSLCVWFTSTPKTIV